MPTPPTQRKGGVVVIGGANVDVRARSHTKAVPATSNPGTVSRSAGGVGRNVAENLARLGTPVRLVAAVGRDDEGDRLLADTAAAGVDVDHVVRTAEPTGSYLAVLDADGELVVAVSDMAGTDALRPDHVRRVRPLVAAAEILVVDGNLGPQTLAACLDLAHETGTPVVLDPVSVPKAARVATLLDAGRPLLALTPNLAELGALTARTVADETDITDAAAALHQLGVTHVWVRLGPAGSVLSSTGATTRLDTVPGPVVDVTGAGDAMLAAFCHGLVAGRSPAEAARRGHAAAALTVAVPHTVRQDLNAGLVEETLNHPTDVRETTG
jgi:pseudouridine kinase